MLLSTLHRVSKFLLCLLLTSMAWADNVLVIHQNYAGVHTNVGNRLVAAGHTVTYSSTEVTNVSAYDQIWDVRYGSMSSTAVTTYDNFVKNGGFLYLTTENPGCCAARNNQVAALISAMGGGAGLTIGGAAGSTNDTITTVNTTYMTALGSQTIKLVAASAIINYGNGQWLMKDASGKVAGVMWAGGAGNLDGAYSGTVITVSDINWIDSTYFTNNNRIALDDIIAGIVYATVQGTITETGNSGGGSAATPVYSSGITAAQSARKTAAQANNNGHTAILAVDGSDNEINIQQIAGRHYLTVDVDGNSNALTITQTGAGFAGVQHYLETGIVGSSNTVNLTQSGTNKTAFVSVGGDYNILTVNQKDSGNHYLDVSLIGDHHTAAIIQEGSGSHAAAVSLTNGGGAWNFQLNQTGSTGQTYSLPHSMSDNSTISGTCSVSAGCNLTVTQQ